MITLQRTVARNLQPELIHPLLANPRLLESEAEPYLRRETERTETLFDDLFVPIPDEVVEVVPQIERDTTLESEIEQEQLMPVDRLLVGMTDLSQSLDPVRLYLREIGRHPLLSSEEEIELARQIDEGRHAMQRVEQLTNLRFDGGDTVVARFLQAQKQLDRIHEFDLRRKLEQHLVRAQKAHHRLSQCNLRLVVSVAKRYTSSGVSLLDLIQEGSMGLLRAVDKFDYKLGYKFSTYATWWIRQSISRAIADQARLIRLPIHMSELINRQTRTQRKLEQELGRTPSFEELALAMEMLSPDDANMVRAGMDKRAPLNPEVEHRLQRVTEKLVGMQRLSQEPLSLNAPVRTAESGALGDFIKDDRFADPDDAISFRQLQEEMSESLLGLHERERQVIELRFGLEDGTSHTLEEIAQLFNITRERVRQIEAKALRKLRHPLRSGRLRSYLS
jgi:RNA polymerase primary sigma factor